LLYGLHQGIISGKDWVSVQLLLEKNADKCYRAAGKPKKQTIVSGMLKCKECGSHMRPKNMDRRREDGTVNYRYCCALKEKSRGKKCNSLNISGERLDNSIINIIKDTFVPNSEIYNELKKMSLDKEKDTRNEELHFLENAYQKNQCEIDKLIENMKYLDVDLIDIVNQNLRKLKEKKEELELQITNLKNSNSKQWTNALEIKTAKDVLKIIDNSFKIFNSFTLKTKRDILELFVESITGSGEDIEITFLNTKLDENKKKVFIPTLEKVDDFFDNSQSKETNSKIAPKEQ